MLFFSRHSTTAIVVCVIALSLLDACIGRFDRNATLSSVCDVAWPQQTGFDLPSLPDSTRHTGLHVLVFNIHDRLLPGSFFSDDVHTDQEMACIGDLASQFDLVFFQEAFVRPVQLARYTGHVWADHPLFTKGGGGDWWPLRLFCEICLSPGLLMLAREEPEFTYAEPYNAFAGWNTDLNKADDFFSKGFQLVQFSTFWALNSHMDSGSGQDSIDARALQFRQLTATLNTFVPHDAPLFVGMDSNLRPNRIEQDGVILREFLEDNGLVLVIQNGPDLIAVRNLDTEAPRILMMKEVLSDHNALSIFIPSIDMVPSQSLP